MLKNAASFGGGMLDTAQLSKALEALVVALAPAAATAAIDAAILDGRLQGVGSASAGEKLLFTVEEASAALGVPEGTLAHWRRGNKGPSYVRMGKRVCYTREALNAYVQSRVVRTGPQAGCSRGAGSGR